MIIHNFYFNMSLSARHDLPRPARCRTTPRWRNGWWETTPDSIHGPTAGAPVQGQGVVHGWDIQSGQALDFRATLQHPRLCPERRGTEADPVGIRFHVGKELWRLLPGRYAVCLSVCLCMSVCVYWFLKYFISDVWFVTLSHNHIYVCILFPVKI